MRVLGIETSCDETGIAIYDDNIGIIANKLHSQTKIHANYGGVVPELASRDHIYQTIPLIKLALKETNLHYNQIDGVAYTAGPGLIGALLVGATIGKSLAFSWKVPSIPINHMEAHLLAPMLEKKQPSFPFIALLVSGGHTELISVTEIGKYKILGSSIDDAVGEAFDKIAKLLGFDYPGGAELSNIAKYGRVGRFIFPRPMINISGLDFSFSGLKTFATNIIHNNKNDYQTKADIARAFEDAIIETLLIKCKRALNKVGFNTLIVSGGVSANNELRKHMAIMMHKRGGNVFYARPEFCTDNGAMIAYTGMVRLKKFPYLYSKSDKLNIKVYPRWPLSELLFI